MTTLLNLASDWLYYSDRRLDNSAHVTIGTGVTAVIGPNGAGKSMLADVLEKGRNFRTNRIIVPQGDITVKKVEFADIHSLRGIAAKGYYQQRYEATMNDDVPLVRDLLADGFDIEQVARRCASLGMHGTLDKRVNYLSSGELRKLLIATALLSSPDLLILDNPYIGLDAPSRQVLDEALEQLAAGVNIMLLVCDPCDIPHYTTSVIPVAGMKLYPVREVTAPIEQVRDSLMYLFDYAIDTSRLPRPLSLDNEPVGVIASFEGCRVGYASKTLIDSFRWIVRDNERWALEGKNGSGKSTLLSLVNADNPAGYSSPVTLFDRRRGSGESIWDIKRRIGYVSPEMRLYFSATGDALTVIGQGLNDTVGSFVKLRPDQIAQAQMWVDLLHLEHVARRPWNTLSAGERQLVLVARAMIKQPRLLILDEPMHGLDYGRKRALRALINYFAARADLPGSLYPVAMIYVTHDRDELPECINRTKSLSSCS